MKESILKWDEIEYEVEQIWRGKPELIWAKKAWRGIINEGLASYKNEIEKHLVLIRLLTLATIYKEFYSITLDESFDLESEYYDWVEHIEISSFRMGQIVGNDFEIDLEDYDNELLDRAIIHLINESKYEVFVAIIKEFGNEEKLFHWLWITVGHTYLENPYENKNDDDDEKYDINTIVEFTDNGKELELYEDIINYNFHYVLNEDVDIFDDNCKFMAYDWVKAKGML